LCAFCAVCLCAHVALAENKSITHLDASDNKITSEGACALARNPRLHYVNLKGNQITDEGGVAFAHSHTKWLQLRNNHIGDVTMRAFADNSHVTWLDVSFGHVSDEGAQALMRNKTLTHVEVGSQVSREVASALRDVLANNRA
jgi:Ran GTPase-activating protein (RanGAP) involved in mRNA processing and transport